MPKIAWIIIGIIVYFLIGWIAKDITFSMIGIDNETTLGELTLYEMITYSAVAGGYIAVMSFIQGDNEGSSVVPILVLAASCYVIYKLPISIGAIILYNIINIGCIIWSACKLKDY